MNQELAQRLWCYDPDTGVFTWRIKPSKSIAAGTVTGSPDSEGYLQLCYSGKRYKAHRIAWLYVYGFLPDSEIDHRDRNPANNRIANLRPATKKQNAENTKARRGGGFRGVYWFQRTQRWVVWFKHNGKQKNLGYFPCLLNAVATRIRAERQFYTHSPFSA